MDSKFLVAPLMVASLALSSGAWAQSAADKETARGLMSEGRAARDNGNAQAALKAFAGADAVMHVPTTGLELARAQTAVGQLVEARDTALRVMRLPETEGEPPPFKQARQAASALNDELEGRIPSLKVIVLNVPEGKSASVSIDGAAVPSELIGQPRKLNPGHHVVIAKAGTAQEDEEVNVAEKESKEITIELPDQAPGADKATRPAPDQGSTGKSGASTGLMWAGIGVAGLGTLVGGITGVLSMSKTNSLKNSCPNNQCPPSTFDDLSNAQSMATISTVSFAAAGVGAVIATIGLLTGNSEPPPQKPATDDNAARFEPWLGVGAAGVRGRF